MITNLPPGITARVIDGVNGLRMHVLEAGTCGRPCILLLHGFPELAFSWRKVMPALAQAGFHVVAPDQRGYGRTTGWDPAYDGDVGSFRLLNLVRDALALLDRVQAAPLAAVVGHDFGASVAAWCALLRPEIFPRLALMSAPFTGPPAIGSTARHDPIHAALAALPRPRKHYQWYYSGREADADMSNPPQGLARFLRAYFHMKSADWPNDPQPLPSWSAEALAVMPTYYIMDQAEGMAATVAPHAPAIEAPWLTDAELAVYAAAYASTGFQGALNWYRCRTEGRNAELEVFARRTIDVPALFIAGRQDWGIHQVPGSLDAMQRACPNMSTPVLVDGAGHWVQQEQPAAVIAALLELVS
jgi:pimeloyl-ACP methyl ester carboxylesterase